MNRPLNILQVSHQWHEGGSALYAAAIGDELARQGAKVRRFGPENVSAARRRGFSGTLSDPAVEEIFSATVRGIDIVHFHHLSGLSLELPRLAKEAGAKVVFMLHDYWLGCARGQLVNDAGNRCEGWSVDRCTACLSPHLYAPAPPKLARMLPPRKAPVRARHETFAKIKSQVDLWQSPSRHVANRVGVSAESLPYPLLRAISAAPNPGVGPVRFLFLGSLIPTKGADVLLAAFASLPAGSATLRIVGPSPLWNGQSTWSNTLIRRIAEIPGAHHVPFVPHASVEAELHASDVLCVPSTWEENAPLVLHEAAAAGLRIVASDIGGIPETAPNAALAEAGSVLAWRNALIAEVRNGRARVSPVLRESVREHSATLLVRYARLLSRG